MPDGRKPEPGGWNRIIINVADLQVEVARLKRPKCTSAMTLLAGRADQRSCWMTHREIR